MISALPRRLVAFDFDRTLIDADSDQWTISTASEEEWARVRAQSESVQWTDLVHETLGRLHERGLTSFQIQSSLAEIPFNSSMFTAIELLSATPKTDLIIISDSNSVFIETILRSRGLLSCFDRIITNPAEFNDHGRLCVRRRVPEGVEHGCESGLCKENICKGKELMEYIEERGGYDEVVYLGDATNDFCPATKLESSDTLLARSDYKLHLMLRERLDIAVQVHARVAFWRDGDDVLEFVRNMVGKT